MYGLERFIFELNNGIHHISEGKYTGYITELDFLTSALIWVIVSYVYLANCTFNSKYDKLWTIFCIGVFIIMFIGIIIIEEAYRLSLIHI